MHLSFRVGNIVELFSGNAGFVPEIESILDGGVKTSRKTFRESDFATIKGRLESIGSVGDITDYVEIAQLVARHMCTRYRSQLICLKPNVNSNPDSVRIVEEVSPPKSSWNCCSSEVSTKRLHISNQNETSGLIATFAAAFIIHAIISGKIKSSTLENLSRREALASMLVLVVCRANRTTETSLFQSVNFKDNKNLPVEQKTLLKVRSIFNSRILFH
jgi:hypothetical protein